MSLVMRAALALQAGCQLRYDPPLGGDDYRSEQFFKEHRGKAGEFLGYGEKLVGILDFQGRGPGRYIDPDFITVRFENESEVHRLNSRHLVVIDPAKAALVEELEGLQRLGDLPHEVRYYPGDTVRYVANRPEQFTDVPHQVGCVFIEEQVTKGGVPCYEVLETTEEHRARLEKLRLANAARPEGERLWLNPLDNHQRVKARYEDLALVSRGNVYWLYHAAVEMHFVSDADEAEFWSRTGISRPIGGDHTLLDSLRKFRSGEADIILMHGSGAAARYYPHRLLDRWAAHRPRVRALTLRLYKQELNEAA